ncbi:gamma-glutamylcyclotransferase [Cupriavidus necator]|uniref:gamma-glutamylcyclotransferase n=1 Tax=Cupriavidus necator TaxID=106590 RepID=UPI0005B4D08A|nr:gamma-glutamylcyclotransferase [Cupriavidus necator]
MSRDTFPLEVFLKAFATLPDGLAWTMERVTESMIRTLAERELGESVWLFGAGSLMWNPGIAFEQRHVAILEGYRRSFCLRMIAGRGSSELPGRMLALEPGGVTRGIVYRLREDLLHDDLLSVWRREMVLGSYTPRWLTVTLEDGSRVAAIVFVANSERPHYETNSSVDAVAPLIARARGPVGSNADYVCRLKHTLDSDGIVDSYVDELHRAILLHR